MSEFPYEVFVTSDLKALLYRSSPHVLSSITSNSCKP